MPNTCFVFGLPIDTCFVYICTLRRSSTAAESHHRRRRRLLAPCVLFKLSSHLPVSVFNPQPMIVLIPSPYLFCLFLFTSLSQLSSWFWIYPLVIDFLFWSASHLFLGNDVLDDVADLSGGRFVFSYEFFFLFVSKVGVFFLNFKCPHWRNSAVHQYELEFGVCVMAIMIVS